MKYNFSDLSDKDKEKREKAVLYFISSDVPNAEFLKQFFPPYAPPYSLKTYWEGCAQVLCGRGLFALENCLNDLLLWWQDKNWPGFCTVENFVLENKVVFLSFIKGRLREAYNEKDIGWFKNLLELLLKTDLNLTEKQIREFEAILEYLEDDCWKDFETKFNPLCWKI